MRVYDALPPVTDISTPNLTDKESALLLDCINKVRSGEKEYLVLLTNKKVTNTPKRMPVEDYQPHPALAPNAHKGWLVAAPTNKEGKVYLHLLDGARIPPDDGDFGHTRITMDGILSFEVLRERPGPLAPFEYEAGPEAPQPEHGPPPPIPSFGQPFDPRVLMAQALMFQAQAMLLQAQALMAQAMLTQPVHQR